MKKLPILALLFLLAAPAWATPPDASYLFKFSNRSVDQADNLITYTVTAGVASTVSIGNISLGCSAWSFSYDSEGFSAATIALQSAPSSFNGAAIVAGAYVSFGGTGVLGSNPSTATTSSLYTATGYYPFVRVALTSSTGIGSINISVNCWKSPAFISSNAGGGGTTITGGTCTNQVMTAISAPGVPVCTTITSAYVDTSICSNVTCNQTAALATALAASPANCGAGQFPRGINASGVAQNCTKLSQVFFVTAAPGSIAGNLPGDFASDTTNHHFYGCNATSGTAAPACTSVATNGWQQIDSVGGGTPGGSNNDLQVNNAGAFGGGRGTLDSSGNEVLSGGLTTGNGGSVAGYEDLKAGTAHTAAGVGFQAPTTVTTPFLITLPAAPTTGFLLSTGTTDPTTGTLVPGNGTGNVCLTTNCAMTTPNLGTPSAGVLSNATGLPINTGVSGLGAGIAAALALAPSGTGAPCLATGSACAGGGAASITTGYKLMPRGITWGYNSVGGGNTFVATRLQCQYLQPDSNVTITKVTFWISISAPAGTAVNVGIYNSAKTLLNQGQVLTAGGQPQSLTIPSTALLQGSSYWGCVASESATTSIRELLDIAATLNVFNNGATPIFVNQTTNPATGTGAGFALPGTLGATLTPATLVTDVGLLLFSAD